MASTASLRFRRNAAQLHALAGVEREIRANDHNGRRKYLQAFSNAFRSYVSVLDPPQLRNAIHTADTVLVGDYHALPASQRFAARLLEERAQPGDRPVVLGVETILARDQHILAEWWRREIDEDELRERVRFKRDWGYEWSPFYELLVTAREHAEAIYGLDCTPREDLRKIGVRDRHAAHKIAEIRQRHPNAVILVLFGESHLAPEHLPHRLRQYLSTDRMLTVLQNVDPLYWQAAGEKREQVEAVQVTEQVVCVFNSTPLEKYESYRLCLARWRKEDDGAPDVGPTIYNLIDSLVQFLGINRYSAHNSTQPKFLVDLLPEVCAAATDAQLRRHLSRRGSSEVELENVLQQLEERGSAYVPQSNSFYVRDFQMMYAAEEAARFLHYACRGLPPRNDTHSLEKQDAFYRSTVEHALAYFGSRVLYPARAAVRDESECSRTACEQAMEAALRGNSAKVELCAQVLGYRIGSAFYDAYLAGNISRSRLRHLFLAHLQEPGIARQVCRELIGQGRASGRKKELHMRAATLAKEQPTA